MIGLGELWAMVPPEFGSTAILGLYYVILGILALYGLHRLALVWSYRCHGGQIQTPDAPEVWPIVTVQLPLFNERNVAERLIEAVCALEYPRGRLEIQVLDDSTDDTREIVERKVAEMRRRGHDVVHLHRSDRCGYKAGALAAGCEVAKGEQLAVFDADFVPPPSFLVDSVPHFTADPELGMAQARWGHLNRDESLLTSVQAILLDGHFVVEHTARHRSGCLFNFNGTAGIWRKQAIVDAGGWHHDTLTEDLDLSYRAQLAGWRFLYLPDLVVPAELPADVDAYKSQQHRWAKGSIQTARKLLGTVLRAPLSLRARLEAAVHLTANASYLLMLALSALIFPAMYLRRGEDEWMLLAFDLPLFLAATVSVVIFFVHSQGREGGEPTWRCLLRMPALMAVGIGLSVNNARAVWDGLWHDGGVFHRTPKAGETKALAPAYRLRKNLSFALEAILAVYFVACFVLAFHFRMWLSIPFLWLFLQGFVYMTWLGLERRPPKTPREQIATAATVLLATLLLATLLLAPSTAYGSPTDEIFSNRFEQGTVLGWSSSSGAGPLVPPEVCTPPIAAVDTSGATTVGTGTPGSCTETELAAAVASNNGAIQFDCGGAPHTITLTSQLQIDNDLVIDGGGLITLSGGGTTRIVDFRPPFEQPRTLTVQNLTFRDGSTASLPGTTTDNGGAAIYRGSFGTLNVIDSHFYDNVGPASGQDVAGGAIYSFGATPTTIVGSVFQNNRCSSGGALGHLFAHLNLVNSILEGNQATGTGGNPGNGGNGGAIYSDGNSQTMSVCGSVLMDNTANARGGGFMRVSNNGVGPMTFDRSWIHGNVGTLQAGGLYLQGLQTTIVDSTISANVSDSRGGMTVFTNPGTQTLNMTNVTLADNFATGNLGAGMAVDNAVTGTLSHLTIVRNGNSGEFSFASAIAGGAGLTQQRSLIVDNEKLFIYENTSCNTTRGGSGNVQWPQFNEGGQSELACATGVTFQDVPIGPLVDNGGPTPTVMPADSSIVESLGGCSGMDQRGVARGATCTPGAVEP